MSRLLKGLTWRSAIKTFAPIAPNQVNITPILEAARLAPSSFGLQPYNIHVVTNNDLKIKLREVSYDQPQVTECSHLLIFTARRDVSESIERFIKSADVEKAAPEHADTLRKCFVSTLDSNGYLTWSTTQAFIAFGLSVAAAAEMEIGACPMTGFDPDGVHKVLGLPASENPVAYLAVGSTLDKNQDDGVRVKLRLKLEDLAQFHH
jgi:nitroreductase/dihydropteridine reductase